MTALPGAGDAAPSLRVGQTVVARVLAPSADGRSMLSIAGRSLAAQLPAGVQPGERLVASVREVTAQQIILELVRTQAGGDAVLAGRARALARLAGELALNAGDSRELAAALRLAQAAREEAAPLPTYGPTAEVRDAGPAAAAPQPSENLSQPPAQAALLLELPGGRHAELIVDEQPASTQGQDGAATARLVLHGKTLGPVEITLWLSADRTQVRITGDPVAADRLEAARGVLEQALTARLDRPAAAQVAARAVHSARPVAPEGFEAYG